MKWNVWVFGSFEGQFFFQNTKALYLYVAYNCPNIKAVWVTRNKQVLKYLRQNNLRAYHSSSIMGIWYCLIARYHIVDWGKNNTNYKYQFFSKLVNMWHGIPLKRLERDILVEPKYSQTRSKSYIRSFENECFGKPSVMLSCSSYDREKLSSAFNVPIDFIYITGFPRNDWITGSLPILSLDKQYLDMLTDKKKQFSKLILYMPTFRDGHFYDEFKWITQDFVSFLKDQNSVMYIKGHVASMSRVSFSDEDNVVCLAADVDIYPLLTQFDCLITDYSSIYFDFALSGKQIIHFTPELDTYRQDIRGFYIDVESHLGGSFCRSVDQIQAALMNGMNNSQFIVDTFHVYRSDFCERVVSLLHGS